MDPLRITTWLRDTQGQVAGDDVRLLVADVQAWAFTWLQKVVARKDER